MTNPYETLGVREGATQGEIKAAYRELVKKYHPDRYDDNPLKDLAEEKLRSINEAYDYLEKNNFNQNSFYNGNNNYYNNGEQYSNSQGYKDPTFLSVRDYLNMNNLRAAEQELNNISDKSAEWYFLRGVLSMRKGWYNQGYNDLQTAVAMDPTNNEYRQALNNVNYNNNAFMNDSYGRRSMGNNDLCDTLTCFCCTDQLCNCLGGDLCFCC